MNKSLSIIPFIALFVTPALALVPEQVAQQQLVIQQQQQQLIDAQIRANELANIATASPYADNAHTAKTTTNTESASGKCINISQVNFGGNTLVSDRRIRKITRQYENRCLTVDEINNMLKDITNVYIDRGYATSRAFMEMPQTHLKDGILDIFIIEGKINKISGLKLGEQITAFPHLHGKILNIRDIEQGMDQINRLGSNRAKMDIRATPTQDGISDIIITNELLGRTQVGATVDSYGTESTGVWRAGLQLTEENLLGLNDQIILNYTNSLVDDMGARVSRSVMASVSIPVGYWTFSNNFSYSYYKTNFPMPVSGDLFFSLGDSFVNTTSLDRILTRGQTYKFGATVSLTYKNNINKMRVYDLETNNEASSRSLAVLNFDMPLTLYFPRGMMYLKPGMTQGVNIFGAPNDESSIYPQRAQYTAFKFYGYTGWNFAWLSVSSALDAQYSPDELYSTESFYLGGQSSIRGFRNDSSTGDSGFSLRNDIDLNLSSIFKTDNKLVRAFTPGVFFDFGMTFPNSDLRDNGLMSGAGVKMGFKYWLINACASYAQVLAKEDWMTENNAVYIYAGLSGRF